MRRRASPSVQQELRSTAGHRLSERTTPIDQPSVGYRSSGMWMRVEVRFSRCRLWNRSRAVSTKYAVARRSRRTRVIPVGCLLFAAMRRYPGTLSSPDGHKTTEFESSRRLAVGTIRGDRTPDHRDGVERRDGPAEGDDAESDVEDQHDERAGNGAVEHAEGSEKEGKD